MQNVSELYNDIISQDNHWFEVALAIGESGRLIDEFNNVLYFGNTAILVDSGGAATAFREDILMSLSTKHAVFNENYPVVGSAVSGEIDIQMLKPTADIPKMARLVPFVRATNGTQTSEWLQKGVYYVDTRETSHNSNGLDIVTIHGYDAMLKFEMNYPSDSANDYPMLDTDMVQFLADSIQISVDQRTFDRMDKGYTFALPVGYSSREVLGIIAASYGGNFIISDEGQLLLIRLSDLPRETNYLIEEHGDILVFGEDMTVEFSDSGAVVSFIGYGNPLDELTANIVPVQNLNGYANPWPPGGGKNLFDEPNATVYSKRYLTPNNTWTVASNNGNRSYAFPCQPSTTYTVSASNQDLTIFRAAYIKEATIPSTGNITVYDQTRLTGPGSITITTSADATFIVVQINASITDGKVQIEVGSSASAWTPYSNICPITGHTGANAYVKAAYDAGATPTVSVTFTDQGTLYGGTYVFVSGKLTVTHTLLTITQSDLTGTPSKEGSLWRIHLNREMYDVGYPTYALCDKYVYQTNYTSVMNNNNSFATNSGDGDQVLIHDDTFTSATDVIATFPINIYIPLATPLVYDLTPQSVSSLVGTNNIWADTGDISLTYSFTSEAVRILV